MLRRPVLLDANSLISRNIHATALDDLKANKTFTGGVYGALNQLKSMLSKFHLLSKSPVGRVYALFDEGVPQFRKDAIPTYKMARKEKKELLPPEELERMYAQIAGFRKILPYLGVTCYSSPGWEADDLVAACARAMHDASPLVVSGDKDLFQLVTGKCSVYYLNTSDVLTDVNFQETIGVPPECFLVCKLLQGDASDSIPGVRGIGKVRAIDLVSECIDKDIRFCNLSPLDQLVAVINTARSRPKPKSSEQAFWDDDAMDALALALTGIDLKVGSPDISSVIRSTATVDRAGFVAECKAYKFVRFLADLDNFVKPFVTCCSTE